MEVTITLNAPATAYLEKLKKQAGAYTPTNSSQNSAGINRTPNVQRYQNPNENFTAQRALVDGVAPVSGTSRTNIDGLNERDQQTAARGDIATGIAEDQQTKRRSEQDALQAKSLEGGLGFNPDYSQFSGGFDGSGNGSGLDGEQLGYARQIAAVGKARGLGQNEIQIALMTALTESGLRNLNHGDRDSVGLFQQRTSQGWGSVDQIMNPNYSIGKFYDALGSAARGANPWNTAQNVQRSFDPNGNNYRAQYSKALQAYRSISSPQNSTYIPNQNLNNWIQSNNNKYIDMDGQFGAQCVDLYNKYTSTFVGGKNFMVGYAPEIYNNYDSRAYTRFDKYQRGRAGDVVIWGRGQFTPAGHVAIVIGDNNDGTLRVLQSNATSAGSAGNSIISNMSKAALMGYLRPNKLMGR